MSNLNDNMEEMFNLPKESKEITEYKEPDLLSLFELDNVNLDKDLRLDYETSRQTSLELIEKGKIAIDEMLMFAKESESARAYEVVATMIKTISETNEKILDMNKKIRDITNYQKNKDNINKGTTNNIEKAVIFTGTTAELTKVIKEINEKSIN